MTTLPLALLGPSVIKSTRWAFIFLVVLGKVSSSRGQLFSMLTLTRPARNFLITGVLESQLV